MTALDIAVSQNDETTCRMLLDNGANVQGASSVYTGMEPPLICAATAQLPKICALLLAGKANVDDIGRDGLYACACKEQLDMCVFLLEAKINSEPCGGDERWSPLAAVAAKGNTAMCKALLDHKVSVDSVNGHAALASAAACGHVDTCRFLLAARANATAVNSADRSTPLHRAAKELHAETCVVLLDGGVPPDAKNSQGLTAVQLADAVVGDRCLPWFAGDWQKKRLKRLINTEDAILRWKNRAGQAFCDLMRAARTSFVCLLVCLFVCLFVCHSLCVPIALLLLLATAAYFLHICSALCFVDPQT
jgi:ankyrin repeat protein